MSKDDSGRWGLGLLLGLLATTGLAFVVLGLALTAPPILVEPIFSNVAPSASPAPAAPVAGLYASAPPMPAPSASPRTTPTPKATPKPSPAPTPTARPKPTPAPSTPPPPIRSISNTFYSGYETDISSGSFSQVVGNWTQPDVTCSGSAGSDLFIWVGIDDNGTKYLEQAGSAAECLAGSTQPYYYAWYEMFPAPSVSVPLRANPGDKMRTTILASGSTFSFKIENLTSRTSWTGKKTQRGAQKLSAYWIVEAPSDGITNKVLPMAKFSRITVTGAAATANGHTAPILDRFWAYRWKWTMLTSGGASKATTSDLTNGDSFSSTWKHR